MKTKHPYTPAWRAKVRDGARTSAGVIAQLIVDEFHPVTAIDVGCGEGFLVDELEQLGVDALGVDGDWATTVPVISMLRVDLGDGDYPDLGPYDMATCLEVAEHVPAARAGELIDWLCSLADTVVFSAAVPGQGGEGHVNEQWPQYWVDLFAARGYEGTGALRTILWDNQDVEWWYRQNLLVFSDHLERSADGCPALVHPGAWAHKGHG